ncbi:MAG TPA: hypothetical protein VIU33_06965 [Nitrospiria bacterium]
MRERRWETGDGLSFREILETGDRLAGLGLRRIEPEKEQIAYVEEWAVPSLSEINRLQAWSQEDVTLQHTRLNWKGDFFLLAANHLEIFRRFPGLGHYCSLSHPFRCHPDPKFHHSRAMFWVGFRDRLSFLRLRLQTHEVITPDELRGESRRDAWLEERQGIFQTAAKHLEFPVKCSIKNGRIFPESTATEGGLFNSWPDAFGPCQTEFNHPDANQSILWAARLAETWEGKPANVRVYLTGFDERALAAFEKSGGEMELVYRLSLHIRLEDLPEILHVVAPNGRVYTTLWEFKTNTVFPNLDEAWMVIGAVGTENGFKLEVRLNRAPLPEEEMGPWLSALFKRPLVYAPLPAFIS